MNDRADPSAQPPDATPDPGVDAPEAAAPQEPGSESSGESPTAPAEAAPAEAADAAGGAEGRQAALVVGVTLSLALIGLVTGITQASHAPSAAPAPPPRAAPSQVQTALAYEDLAGGKLSVNAGWTNDLGKLASERPGPGLFATTKTTPRERRAALRRRAERRAYAGAPPTIPHQVTARTADDCLACHGTGARVGDRVAAPVPHRRYVNCLQCHAPPPPAALADAPVGTGPNLFEGAPEVAQGARACTGAPPTIPHGTRMRSDCLACHGPRASQPGIRTSHPWRVNCRQCHAASAGYAR